MALTQIQQNEQNLFLQRAYILTTGSMANASQLADYNASIELNGNFSSVNTLIDNHINMLVSQQGLVATIQGIAKNAYGLSLTGTQAQTYINEFAAAGLTVGSQLINYLNTVQWEYTSTLDNRSAAASEFINTLTDAGKASFFNGPGVTQSVYNLLQNVNGSASSLANANSGLDALSANLSATGITGTLDGYLSGATVFADANGNGQLDAGEWSTTTSANGTFEVPDSVAAVQVIAFGGTDLLSGNAFKGVLSSSTGSTMLNPMTSAIAAIAADSGSVNDATLDVKEVFNLPADINLLSYNALAVLASSSATSAEKAVALQVQKASQQISNIMTQVSSVIDTMTPGQTLQSAALVVMAAIASAISAAADSTAGTLNLANAATIAAIIQSAVTATGSTTTASQIQQIADVVAGSNTSVAAATNITLLAQAADVAQGSATNALIAGAANNDFSAAVAGFTGTALTTANYNVTVGSIVPGVVVPATVSQNAAAQAAADAAAADAAAAAAALVAPTAVLAYSTDAGVTSATTTSVNDADTLRIIATFDKAVTDGTPTITINNAILAVATAMTKIDATHYFYDLNVPVGDIASATVTIGGARTATSNVISAAPTNAVFVVDNTAPTAATAVTLTAVGGTVIANTLNTTNTNLTATATVTAGEATGGSAVLKIGATTVATDSTILAGDTSVSFSLSTANNTALQQAVAAGGVATVTVTDAAGNASVSAVANPTLSVDYLAPSSPTGVALTPVGGTVVTNSLNSTNTNLTAVATITAGQATGGSAVLKIGSTTIATDSTILVGDTTATFDLSPADNAALQLAVATGGVATVTLIDANGNAAVSSLSNPTLAVDYLATFVDLTTALDNLTGAGTNDTYTGTFGNGAGPYTFNIGDIINGEGGSDTLNITTGAEASTPPDGLWANISNFEKVVFNSLGNGAQVVTTGANFETAFATQGADVTVQTLLGAIDLTMTTFTGAATITTITTG
ncbi:MAG: hypothetical protein KKD00_03785, partial [Gammaproteobacteria bacterium]|nr:hypothetical protein [Gammaproteobacteria bacterium]